MKPYTNYDPCLLAMQTQVCTPAHRDHLFNTTLHAMLATQHRDCNINCLLCITALPTETSARCCVCSLVDPSLPGIAPAPERFVLLCYSSQLYLGSLPATPLLQAASKCLPSRHEKAVCLLPAPALVQATLHCYSSICSNLPSHMHNSVIT